jgi:hypothetical protein
LESGRGTSFHVVFAVSFGQRSSRLSAIFKIAQIEGGRSQEIEALAVAGEIPHKPERAEPQIAGKDWREDGRESERENPRGSEELLTIIRDREECGTKVDKQTERSNVSSPADFGL